MRAYGEACAAAERARLEGEVAQLQQTLTLQQKSYEREREIDEAEIERLRAAALQASFCLRTLFPDDPDARMTVTMLRAALEKP